MGIVRNLWKVVRRPMTRWWIINGSWWLAGIAVLTIVDSLILQGNFPLQFQISFTSWNIINRTNYFIPLVLIVIAASACDGFIFTSYEKQAAPMPKEVLWGRYLLALCQAIPIAVTISLILATLAIFQQLNGMNPSGDCPFAIWIFTIPLKGFAGYAVSALWLVLFVVLASNRPVFKYGFLFANFVATALNCILYLTVMMSMDFHFSYTYSESGWLFLFALPLWLILASALKNKKFILAGVLYAVASVSAIGYMSLTLLYDQFGGSLLKGIAFSSEVINAPYQPYSQIFPSMIPLLGGGLDPNETLLGYLPFLIQPILSWINPVIILALIYLFVFSSYPCVWVEYLRKKLQSLNPHSG